MTLRAIIANHLADLFALQPGYETGPEQHHQQEGGDGAGNRTEGDVTEDIEPAQLGMKGIQKM